MKTAFRLLLILSSFILSLEAWGAENRSIVRWGIGQGKLFQIEQGGLDFVVGHMFTCVMEPGGVVRVLRETDQPDDDFVVQLAPAVGSISLGVERIMALSIEGDVKVFSSYHPRANWPKLPRFVGKAISVAALDEECFVLRPTGEVNGWPQNSFASFPKASAGKLIFIAGGSKHLLGLTTDGKVIGSGDNTFGQLDIPEGMSDVQYIGAGGDNSFALTRSGEFYAWGEDALKNQHGYFKTNGIVFACCAESSILALTSSGALVQCAVLMVKGMPPDIQPPVVYASGSGTHGYAIRGNGAPRIIEHPIGRQVRRGQEINVYSFTYGLEVPKVQWFRNGVPLVAQTNALLRIPEVNEQNVGKYFFSASNQWGEVRSREISIEIEK